MIDRSDVYILSAARYDNDLKCCVKKLARPHTNNIERKTKTKLKRN